MTRLSRNYVVCDQCNGVISADKDRFQGVGGQVVYQGAERDPFADLDFCCSEHLMGWLSAQPTIPTPDPAYPQPPPA